MQAILHDRYGPPSEVLRLGEIDQPVPRDHEVLVRVRAASVHPDIWHMVAGEPYLLRLMGNGVLKPKRLVPGSDLAGVVESVGRNVKHLKIGDEVFGESVGFGWHNGGAYAEYAAVPEDFLALKPPNVTFEQAAAVPTAGYIAFSNLIAVDRPGMNVLINGAGGCMGTLALQMAKARGARVTAVDCAEKLPLLRSLGADHLIDYTKENFLEGRERYDYILDVASNLWFDVCAPVLTPTGIYTPIGHAQFGRAKGRMGGRILGSMPSFIGLMLRTLLNKEKRKKMKIPTKAETVAVFRKLFESGQLTPVIAQTYPLSGLREAMQTMMDHNPIGRLIITP